MVEPQSSRSDTDMLIRSPGPGFSEHKQAALWVDRYEAINLREALKIALDTGDWHGQLRYKLDRILEALPDGPSGPNAFEESQRERMGLG